MYRCSSPGASVFYISTRSNTLPAYLRYMYHFNILRVNESNALLHSLRRSIGNEHNNTTHVTHDLRSLGAVHTYLNTGDTSMFG